MGEELFPIPLEAARKTADPPVELKSKPAKVKAAPAEPKPEATPKPTEGDDKKTAWQTSSQINGIIEGLGGHNSEISIEMDPETRKIIVKVLNSATGEVIRRMPLRDPIHWGEDLTELKGLLLDVME